MKLNVSERVNLLTILPTSGSYITHKIITELKSDLSFSEEEIKDFGIKEIPIGNNQVTIVWDGTKSKEEKEIIIGEKMTEIITKVLKELDEKEQITNNNISLYEKIIIDKS